MYYDQMTYLLRVTDQCFLKCPHCLVGDELNHDEEVMEPYIVKDLIQKSRGFRSVWIAFLGGEPLMAGKDWFRKVFKIMKEEGDKLMIPVLSKVVTNGIRLDEEWIEIFRENNCQITVSWDGVGGGRKGGKKALANLKKFKDDVTVVVTTVTEENHEHLCETLDVLNEAGVKRMSMQYNLYATPYYMSRFGEATCKLFDHIEATKPRINNQLYMDMKNLMKRKRVMTSSEFHAMVINNDYVVKVNGDITVGMPQSDRSEFEMGNILKLSHINDVTFSDKMRKVNEDYVSSMQYIGELEEVNLLSFGGGFPFDKKGIQPMNLPFMAKLHCYKHIVDYFKEK